MGYLYCSYTHFIDCSIHLERNKVLTIRYFCCWNRWPLTIQHGMFAKLQWVPLAFLGQVNNHLSALRFIVVPSQQKRTHWYVHGRHYLASGRSLFIPSSPWRQRLLDPGCVQSVQPRDSERKHRQHLNVCPAVAVTCHPAPKLLLFLHWTDTEWETLQASFRGRQTLIEELC